MCILRRINTRFNPLKQNSIINICVKFPKFSLRNAEIIRLESV